jgi:hypothetical protein
MLDYIYNVNQLSESEWQYNSYKCEAEKHPIVKAWFETKHPVFI